MCADKYYYTDRRPQLLNSFLQTTNGQHWSQLELDFAHNLEQDFFKMRSSSRQLEQDQGLIQPDKSQIQQDVCPAKGQLSETDSSLLQRESDQFQAGLDESLLEFIKIDEIISTEDSLLLKTKSPQQYQSLIEPDQTEQVDIDRIDTFYKLVLLQIKRDQGPKQPYHSQDNCHAQENRREEHPNLLQMDYAQYIEEFDEEQFNYEIEKLENDVTHEISPQFNHFYEECLHKQVQQQVERNLRPEKSTSSHDETSATINFIDQPSATINQINEPTATINFIDQPSATINLINEVSTTINSLKRKRGRPSTKNLEKNCGSTAQTKSKADFGLNISNHMEAMARIPAAVAHEKKKRGRPSRKNLGDKNNDSGLFLDFGLNIVPNNSQVMPNMFLPLVPSNQLARGANMPPLSGLNIVPNIIQTMPPALVPCNQLTRGTHDPSCSGLQSERCLKKVSRKQMTPEEKRLKTNQDEQARRVKMREGYNLLESFLQPAPSQSRTQVNIICDAIEVIDALKKRLAEQELEILTLEKTQQKYKEYVRQLQKLELRHFKLIS